MSQADETQKATADVGVIGDMIIDTGKQVSGLSDTALAEFYKEAVVKYPELTYTFVREK